MPNIIDLKNIEKKIYLSYHDDGIIDISIGFGFLLFSFFLLVSYLLNIPDWLFYGTIAFAHPFYIYMKKKVTFPRFGQVKFGDERKTRIRKELEHFILFSVYVQVLIGPLLLLLGSFDSKRWLLTSIFIIIASASASIAYWKQLHRFYIYAILTIIIGFLGPILNLNETFYILSFHVIFLTPFFYGLLLLKNFLQKYPIVSEELSNVG